MLGPVGRTTEGWVRVLLLLLRFFFVFFFYSCFVVSCPPLAPCLGKTGSSRTPVLLGTFILYFNAIRPVYYITNSYTYISIAGIKCGFWNVVIIWWEIWNRRLAEGETAASSVCIWSFSFFFFFNLALPPRTTSVNVSALSSYRDVINARHLLPLLSDLLSFSLPEHRIENAAHSSWGWCGKHCKKPAPLVHVRRFICF